MQGPIERSSPHPGGIRAWRPSSAIVVVGLAIVLLCAAGLWLATRQSETPERFDPAGPVAAYQAYVSARRDGDTDAAWELVSSTGRAELGRSEFDREILDAMSYDDAAFPRVRLIEVIEDGDAATLRLEFEYVSEPGLFGSGRWTDQRRVRLVKEGADWRLDSPWAHWE